MVEPGVVEQRIRAAFPDAVHVSIEDLTGTKDHYSAIVVAGAFAGMSRVEQHQAVYRALGELIQGSAAPVHALALKTFTPDQWTGQK